MQIHLFARSVIVKSDGHTVHKLSQRRLTADLLAHGRVTVQGWTLRSPLTGCQVTSRSPDRFSRYSKRTDTFRADFVSFNNRSTLYQAYNPRHWLPHKVNFVLPLPPNSKSSHPSYSHQTSYHLTLCHHTSLIRIPLHVISPNWISLYAVLV